jgi:hypothetical protein
VLSPVVDHILQDLDTLYLTRFRTYKIARPHQTKTRKGEGPPTYKNLPQSPFKGQFFLDDDLFWCLYRYLVYG